MYICAACKRSALGQSPGRLPLLSGRWSSFVTLVHAPAEKEEITQSTEENKERRSPKQRLSQSLIRPTQRYTHHRSEKGDLLEALFEDGLQSRKNDTTQRLLGESTGTSVYKDVEILGQMLADPMQKVEDTWHFFNQNLAVFNQSRPTASPPPVSFQATARKLFDQVLIRHKSGPISSGLPSELELAKVYSKLGILVPRQWNSLLWHLLRKLAESTDPVRSKGLRNDVLGIWRVAFNIQSTPSGTASASHAEGQSTWRCIPSLKFSELQSARHHGGVERMVQKLVPRFISTRVKTVSSSAVVSFALVTRGETSITALAHNPLISAIAKTLCAVPPAISVEELEKMLESHGVNPAYSAGVDWRICLDCASEIHRQTPRRNSNKATIASTLDENHIQTLLQRAFKEKDVSAVDRLWTARTQSISQELCDKFILTYMSLRQPGHAIEVWNFMVQNAMTPTLATWNSMLEGARSSRSVSAVENVWKKMNEAHVQPDTACWTTRVTALVEGGKSREALGALDNMAQIWMKAARKENRSGKLESMGDVNGVVKPAIGTINSMIAGLFRRDQSDVAQKVLDWGGRLGIMPDLITYNILLRRLVRDQKSSAVKDLLEHMQTQGIRPDVATFTTILEETFATSKGTTAEEQVQLINRVFKEMAAAGVEPNQRTFSTIIYSIINSEDKTETVAAAVAAVLSNMAERSLDPSPHICTVLVEHYFNQQKPDLEAVRIMLEGFQISKVKLDHIFWDRVVEGYARVGDTGSALNIMGRVNQSVHRIGWFAMETLLRALAKNSEWESAKELVRNIRAERGGSPEASQRGVEGQHSFWDAVAELRILEA